MNLLKELKEDDHFKTMVTDYSHAYTFPLNYTERFGSWRVEDANGNVVFEDGNMNSDSLKFLIECANEAVRRANGV